MKPILLILPLFAIALQAQYLRNHETQTVYDTTYDLTWMDDNSSAQRVSWEEALSYCNALDHAGFNDWRLPNYNELFALMDLTTFYPSLDPAFQNMQIWDNCYEGCSNIIYWTSTTLGEYPDEAYGVDFNDIGSSIYGKDYNTLLFRCVRSGEIPVGPEFISVPPTETTVGEPYSHLIRVDHPTGLPVDVFPRDGLLPNWLSLTPPTMPTNTINIFAGNENAAVPGDGGPATSALIYAPRGVANDGEENTYISDSQGYRIRMVDANGTIHTVAGTGTGGYSGDGLPAIASAVGSPQGMAVDAGGILYFADTNNHCVRKIDADANLVTVAGQCTLSGYNGDGGIATAATLSYPMSVALDGCGNLYIADTANSVVRRVDVETGTISTVAGTGATSLNGEDIPAITANLNWPTDVAYGPAGNLYIADEGHCRIWKVDRMGIISRALGSGMPGNGSCTPYAGGGTAALDTPIGIPHSVAVDSLGDLYVSLPFDNLVIRLDTRNDMVLTAIPIPTDIDTPDQLAFDDSDNLLISDTGNNLVRILSLGAYRLHGTPSESDAGIHDVNLTAEDNNSKVSYQNFAITVAPLNQPPVFTTTPITSGETLTPYTYPISVFDPDGNFTSVTARALPGWLTLETTFGFNDMAGNGSSGFSGDGGPATDAQLHWPTGITMDAEGTLYIAANYNARIRRVGTDGIIDTIAGTGDINNVSSNVSALDNAIGQPFGLAVNRRGELYFSDEYNNCIRKIDSCGLLQTVVGVCGIGGFGGDGGPALDALLSAPRNLLFDADDNLYFDDHANKRIRRVDAQTHVITTVAGTGLDTFNGDGIPADTANLNQVSDMAFDADGNLYFGDYGHCRVRKIDTGGIITTEVGNGSCVLTDIDGLAPQSSTVEPFGVALDKAGTLYIGENARISRINPSTGMMEVVADSNTPPFGGVLDMEFSPAGTLLYLEYSVDTIRRIFSDNYLLTGTPDVNDSGSFDINLTAWDENGAHTSQEFNITVISINTPPTAVDSNVTTDEDTPYTFQAADFNFNDIDLNDTFTGIRVTSVNLPAGSALSVGGIDISVPHAIDVSAFPTFIFTPAPDAFAETYASFTFKVYDGSAYSSAEYTMAIHVLPVNDAPVFTSTPLTAAFVGEVYSYTVTLSDPEGETSLGFSALIYPEWLNVTPQGSGTYLLSGTPQIGDVGVAPVQLEVSDEGGESSLQEFNITVISNNTPPSAADGNVSTDEDTPYAFNTADFNFSDSDVNDTLQKIRITALSLPAGSTLRLNSVDVGLLDEITAFEFANLVFTPAPNESGSAYASFRFKVFDGIEYSAADYLMTIDVASVNDGPPVFTSTAPTAATEGVLYSYTVTLSDADDDTVALTATIKPGWLSLTSGGNNTFTLSGTPGAADVGLNDVTLDADDGNGGTAQQSFVIIVNPVIPENEPPVATYTAFETLENTPFADVLTGTDPEGEPITCHRTAGPAHGTLAIDANCSFLYTPATDYAGADQFTYTVFDGEVYSAPQNVAVTVINVNNPPVATFTNFQTREDTVYIGAMRGTDADNDLLSCTVTQLPANGTLLRADPAICSFSYRPNRNYFGPDAFSYFVSDAEADSAPLQVDIVVTSVNDAPTATIPSAITVNEDGTETIAFSTSDVEGDPVSVSISQNAANGTVTRQSGTFTYAPQPNFNGSDAFALMLDDGNGGTRTYNVAVAVTPEDDLPIVTLDDNITLPEDSIAEVPFAIDNPDSLPLDIVIGAAPSHGTTAFEEGKLFYIPTADYNGPDSFTVEFRVGETTVFVGSVAVTVEPVNDSPAADVGGDDDESFDAIITEENTTKVYVSVQVGEGVESNLTFSDIDGDTLTVNVTAPPAHGSVTLVNGTIGYTPQTDYVGPDEFTVTAEDEQGASHTVVFYISVTAAPASFHDINISLGQKEARDFLANLQGMFAENQTDVVTLRVVTPPAYGALHINETQAAASSAFSAGSLGTVVYRPTAFYYGTDTITFEVTDADNALHSFNVNLDVEKTLSGSLVTYEPGWHLITLPSIGTMRFENTHICWQYRITGDTWLAYSAKNDIRSTYEQLGYDAIESPSIDTGYWCKNTETMTVEHFDDDQSAVVYDALPHGWNLVGTDKQIDTDDAFESTVIVWYYDGTDWAAYSPHEDIRDALMQEGVTVIDTVPEKAGIWVVR